MSSGEDQIFVHVGIQALILILSTEEDFVCTHVIPTPGRWRQEGLRLSTDYIVTSASHVYIVGLSQEKNYASYDPPHTHCF